MSWHVTTAAEFMRRNLVTLTPEVKILDGVTRLLKNNISGAPVTSSEGKYLGVFSEKSCMNALAETVEHADQAGIREMPTVRDFMTRSLTTLSPEDDVFVAIDHLLAKRISGAPVLDGQAKFLGVFSEKTAMRVLISAAYDQHPGASIDAYMNTDSRRIIQESDSLVDVARKFRATPYRRLPVLHDQLLVGQVSRRDVIRSEHQLALRVANAGSNRRVPNADRSDEVEAFMDVAARTINSADDILSIAQVFLNSPYRRLAVVEAGKLLGQVSRRDLLSAAASLLRPTKRRGPSTLYLSPITKSAPPSIG